jgi:hypothetical protein
MEKIPKGAQKMRKLHKIQQVKFEDDRLVLKVDGKKKIFRLSRISEKLAHASERERAQFELSPSGYGIHWPLLDEDLSIDGLLGIRHNPSLIKKAVSA